MIQISKCPRSRGSARDEVRQVAAVLTTKGQTKSSAPRATRIQGRGAITHVQDGRAERGSGQLTITPICAWKSRSQVGLSPAPGVTYVEVREQRFGWWGGCAVRT